MNRKRKRNLEMKFLTIGSAPNGSWCETVTETWCMYSKITLFVSWQESQNFPARVLFSGYFEIGLLNPIGWTVKEVRDGTNQVISFAWRHQIDSLDVTITSTPDQRSSSWTCDTLSPIADIAPEIWPGPQSGSRNTMFRLTQFIEIRFVYTYIWIFRNALFSENASVNCNRKAPKDWH